MNDRNTEIIICNIWIAACFIVDDHWKLVCLIFAIAWFVGGEIKRRKRNYGG